MSDLLTQLIRQVRQARGPWRLDLLDPSEGSYEIRDAEDRPIRVWCHDRDRLRQMVESLNAAHLLAAEVERER